MPSEVRECPFCGKIPEQYIIGQRLSHGEQGTRMVKCMSFGCAIWDKPIYEKQWNKQLTDLRAKLGGDNAK